MGGKKVTIVIDDDDFLLLEKRAKNEGFGRVSGLARYLIVSGLNERCDDNTNKKIIQVSVDNYQELSGYAKAKKLNSVSVFAAFAMEKEMVRHPLTPAQKARLEKNID